MEATPLISVVMPVYNGEPYLAESIRSVMKQTYSPMEIIVVDDGSTDRSAAVARHFSQPITYVYQANSGTAAARNLGVHTATGSFFAFLDQDDLWTADKLSLQMEAFEREPATDMVFGYVKPFLSPDLDPCSRHRIYCPSSAMPGYTPSAMLVKREAFFRVGPFDTTWRVGEWVNWYVRATEQNLNMVVLPDLVAMRRLHRTNKGVLQRGFVNEYIRILKASLDRRRLACAEGVL